MLEAARDHLRLAPRLRQGGPRLQRAHYRQSRRGAVVEKAGQVDALRPRHVAERHEAVHFRVGEGTVEAAVHDPYDGGRRAVDADLSADRAGVPAEPLLPIRVAQHQFEAGTRRLAFARDERPARRRRDPEGRKVVPADVAEEEFPGLGAVADAGLAEAEGDEIRKRARLAANLSGLPGFLTPRTQFGRDRIFDAPGSGYFDVVDVAASVAVNKDSFYAINEQWLRSDWTGLSGCGQSGSNSLFNLSGGFGAQARLFGMPLPV